ncbi:MAG: polyhydroxyalkanoate synthesis regulator DNA-binding domain-containing protein [Acidobacteriota bacterium]
MFMGPVLLKKYVNRRIYDTEKSAYVTLAEVAELIRSGREVQIRDARTEEDVTAFVLTQIVLEEARKSNFLLPVPLLLLIIRYGGGVLEEFFDKYLEISIRNYLTLKDVFDEQLKKWLEIGLDMSQAKRDVVASMLSPGKGPGGSTAV